MAIQQKKKVISKGEKVDIKTDECSVEDLLIDKSRSSHGNQVVVELLDPRRVTIAKSGFSTRRVPKEVMHTLVSGSVRPRAGDVVLARVDRVRQHKRIELPTGRKSLLEPGDEIIIACGNRYATDQFEAFVPIKLGKAHLIAAGGVAGVEAERSRKMRPATEITLLGLIGDSSGVPLNLMSFALPAPKVDRLRPPVVAVFGTSMNSGKTTTARFLVRGLVSAGFRVGYAKLTGTGAGNDYWSIFDSGASTVADFTDAGLVSTYTTPIPVLENTSINLIGYLVAEGCERIVVEVADGLLQSETAALMRSETFHTLIDHVLFASADPIAAIAGVKILQDRGFEVVGVSGLMTASPLPRREATNECVVPVWGKEDLTNPEIAAKLASYSKSQPNIANETSIEMKNTPTKTWEIPINYDSLRKLISVDEGLPKEVLHKVTDESDQLREQMKRENGEELWEASEELDED